MGLVKSSLLVFAGAGLGAVCRYWLGTFVQNKVGGVFPFGTLVVNVSGCLVIGLVMTLILGKQWPDGWRLLLVTGLLGGYTTFSAIAYETFTLVTNRHVAQAVLYVLSSNLLSLAACWLGVSLGHLAKTSG